MTNPYRIEGPALISFSGGRTSAYMLKQIIDAHGGQLPDDVHVCFANTGKEREETLRFVHECSVRWGVLVRWLEWRRGEIGFEEVGFNSAHRKGEPFAALISTRGYLPNVARPWCSMSLKQAVCRKFALSVFGPGRYLSVVGLRYDEEGRVAEARRRTKSKKDAWNSATPLYNAKVTKRDVRAFWDAQGFDLGLLNFEGNCDGCFQKSVRLYEVERYAPGTLDWWIEQEERVAATAEPDARHWILGRSYSEIRDAIRRQPDMFMGAFDADPDDAECGLWCAGEAA
ncbi:3'-phosphoadenosine 5'-phosphosulfate sulfotransferase [Altererythrobacter xixiisoli]|uniref:3'-phosphoadenosine 5'-phosphosulfate sulfotransferase n=1 Tax=Croceibacterium xixiisoli TaxID=1476466 RepID=A0A6I4TVZ6_9SPHN|nr:3'-phosphoadenosine 5'-phosphosulfate sulfotransferase [Croceibacterium xixiisoli]MXO98967.1 3'-phosphoadenosine 5'-phosphosulfate sulfotransferase [Croceibacterium xixiisoli]